MPLPAKKDAEGDDAKRAESLPFEPKQTRKKTPKKTSTPAESKQTAPSPSVRSSSSTVKSARSTQSAQSSAIPEAVSRRMAKRMALFSGIPTGLGILTFVVSYVIVSQHWFKLPNVAVLLVSMGFFGLGVLGLSYGVISASWDEERSGSWHGWREFTTNFGRIRESWKTRRQNSDAS